MSEALSLKFVFILCFFGDFWDFLFLWGLQIGSTSYVVTRQRANAVQVIVNITSFYSMWRLRRELRTRNHIRQIVDYDEWDRRAPSRGFRSY